VVGGRNAGSAGRQYLNIIAIAVSGLTLPRYDVPGVGTNARTAMAKPAKMVADLMATAVAQSAPKRTKAERVHRVPDDIVTITSLARHLGCSRQNITHFTDQGIIQRRPDGHYDQSTCRLAYIAHLRTEYRKSPRAASEQELQKARTRLYQLKVQRAEGLLMETAECDEFVEELMGLVVAAVEGWPARISGTDLTLRHKAERLVFELRTKMADAAAERAAACEAVA
jgi:hypothetical protein